MSTGGKHHILKAEIIYNNSSVTHLPKNPTSTKITSTANNSRYSPEVQILRCSHSHIRLQPTKNSTILSTEKVNKQQNIEFEQNSKLTFLTQENKQGLETSRKHESDKKNSTQGTQNEEDVKHQNGKRRSFLSQLIKYPVRQISQETSFCSDLSQSDQSFRKQQKVQQIFQTQPKELKIQSPEKTREKNEQVLYIENIKRLQKQLNQEKGKNFELNEKNKLLNDKLTVYQEKNSSLQNQYEKTLTYLKQIEKEKLKAVYELQKERQNHKTTQSSMNSNQSRIDALDITIKRMNEDKIYVLRTVQILKNEHSQQLEGQKEIIRKLEAQLKETNEQLKSTKQKAKNYGNEVQWRKQNEKRKDSLISEMNKEISQFKDIIKEQEKLLDEGENMRKNSQKQIVDLNDKLQITEQKKSQLCKQVLNMRKTEQVQRESNIKSKKIEQLCSFLGILGIEANEANILSEKLKVEQQIQKIKEKVRVKVKKHSEVQIEQQYHQLLHINNALNEEIMKKNTRQLAKKYMTQI